MNRLIAAVDIGASAIRMSLGEFEGKKLRILENLSYPLRIGKDTFIRGFIASETLNEAIRILEGYRDKLNEYQIKDFRVAATSAIREAENQEFFLEQVKSKTGFRVEIIERSEELRLIFLGLKKKMKNFKKIVQQGAMFAKIGSGNVEVAFLKQGEIFFSRTIPLGGLRLREMLKEVPESDFADTLENYISSDIRMLSQSMPKATVHYLIATGSLLKMVLDCCKSKKKSITALELKEFYEKIKGLSISKISEKYNLPIGQADLLLPTVYTYLKFLELMKGKKILWVELSFTESLIWSKSGLFKDKFFDRKIWKTAVKIGEKYQFDKTHALQVARLAVKLFDALQPIHQLPLKYRFLLKLAALWHDIGIFIQNTKHHKHSYYLISNFEIPGLSQREIHLIAVVARYHRKGVPKKYHPEYSLLPSREKVIVSKLASFLRIADALDRSHSRRVRRLSVEMIENRVDLRVNFGGMECWLEKIYFKRKKDLFLQVFGIQMELIEEME